MPKFFQISSNGNLQNSLSKINSKNPKKPNMIIRKLFSLHSITFKMYFYEEVDFVYNRPDRSS